MATHAKPDSKTPTRELLLDAAASLMRDRDVLDVSLADIAQRSGANSALVKYYFENKEGLILALIERALANEFDKLGQLVASDRSPEEKLRLHIDRMVRNFVAHPYLHRLLGASLRDCSDARAAELAQSAAQPLAEAHRKILEQGVAAGVFKPVDPMILYFNLVGACDALASSRFALRFCFDREDIDDALIERFIAQTTDMFMSHLLVRG